MLTLLVTISCHCWNYNLNNCNSGKSVVSFRTMHLRRWQQRRKSLMRCHWPLRKEWGSSGKEWSKNIENWSRKIFTFEINFWSFYRTMPLTVLYELFALSLLSSSQVTSARFNPSLLTEFFLSLACEPRVALCVIVFWTSALDRLSNKPFIKDYL